jgi:hypothetical protein
MVERDVQARMEWRLVEKNSSAAALENEFTRRSSHVTRTIL